jgi:hypothetical protein
MNKYITSGRLSSPIFTTTGLVCMCFLLTSCNTTQTLAAQFGAAPLPTAVARKLYGTCGHCDLNPQCPLCNAVQKYNRKLAGATKEQRQNYQLAGTSYRNHTNALYSPYKYNNPLKNDQYANQIPNYPSYQTQRQFGY